MTSEEAAAIRMLVDTVRAQHEALDSITKSLDTLADATSCVAAAITSLAENWPGPQSRENPDVPQMVLELRGKVEKLKETTPAVRSASEQRLGTAQALAMRLGV